MEFSEIVAGRRSVKDYDSTHTVTDQELRTLFTTVALTPSSFNLQHWRFVVVRSAEAKVRLRKAAYGQELLETASAVIGVVGKITAHLDAPEIYAETPPKVQQTVVPMIERFYADNRGLSRDEAIRSASLAAMTLMYAAYEMGYATCPMIGFNSEEVSRLMGLDEDHIPVMLVVLGRQVGERRPREGRLPLTRLVKLERLDGEGLS